MIDKPCRCGHPYAAHAHLRPGTECVRCAHGGCTRYRPPTWWSRLAQLWRPMMVMMMMVAPDQNLPVDSLHVKADALRGHLDAILLAVLDDEPRHGYAIIEALQRRTGGAFALPTGTVYPALRRLERAGLVESDWSTVSGRERRTYRLTSAGRRTLSAERTAWQEFASTIGAVLSPRPA